MISTIVDTVKQRAVFGVEGEVDINEKKARDRLLAVVSNISRLCHNLADEVVDDISW